MIAFQIVGRTNSGKTTTATTIINRLAQRKQSVASIKSVHSTRFKLDQPGKDTALLAQAGASPVVAASNHETDFMYYQVMDFKTIASKFNTDWLVVEGFNDFPLPKIVCAKSMSELEEMVDRRTMAISGVISHDIAEYKKIPVLDSQQPEELDILMNLIDQKTFPLLPYVDDACCQQCGLTCSRLVQAIVQGEKTYHDCKINRGTVQLKIDGKQIAMVPFVQNILRNTITAIASLLDGWEANKKIEITLR